MRKLSLLLPLLLLAGCSKKVTQTVDPSLLEEICRIEEKRHGEIEDISGFTHFGNPAMDTYLHNPGPALYLLDSLRASSGVCRGALFQLLIQGHREYLARNWKDMNKLLTTDEKVFWLRYARIHKHTELADLILSNLKSKEKELRHVAASGLAIIDQEAHLRAIRKAVDSETHTAVLAELIYTLKIENPKINAILKDLYDRPEEEVHEAVILSWSTSNLESKEELLARYSSHPIEPIRDMANSLLVRLKKKDLNVVMVNLPQVVGTRAVKPSQEKQAATKQIDSKLGRQINRALWENKLDKVDELIIGLSPNDEFSYGNTLFESVLRWGKVEMVRAMVSQGANWSATDEDGNNLLLIFARTGRMDIAEKINLLIDLGLDINSLNKEGETPLIRAAFAGNLAQVKVLLARGADPSVRDRHGRTALTLARLMEDEEVIAALQEGA